MKNKIEVEYYNFTKACGCCDEYGYYVKVGGEYLTYPSFLDSKLRFNHSFSDVVEAIQFALDHLEIPVEIGETYEEEE